MKQISLTQGQIALVDDEDYEYLSQWKWRAKWSKESNCFYAVRTAGKRPHRDTVYMARLIMNTPKELDCDHINHDTLNNQKYNLRNCTHAQNTKNRRMYSSNTLRERNITRNKGGFMVVVRDGDYIFRKWYKNLQDAILTRDKAVREIHGEFSSLSVSED